MQRSMRLIALLVLVGALVGACGQPATTAQPKSAASSGAPLTLRLGYFPNVTHAAALVGVSQGFFQKALGSGVTLESKTFNAGPALTEAFLAGELDIAYVGPNPAINGFVKSKGEALRVIAGAASGGASFVVRSEANITKPADLAGKTLATPQLGNTQDVALRYYLEQNGLQSVDKGGTVQINPMQNADILKLFQQGQLDGAWVPEPWASRLVIEGKGKVFVDERDLWPNKQFVTTNIMVSKKFLDAHPDVVTNFLIGHLDAVSFITKDTAAAQQAINGELEKLTTKPLPADVLAMSFETLTVTYDPLPQTLFASADHAFTLGFLGDTQPDLTKIYDLGPLNAALKTKGLPAIALP